MSDNLDAILARYNGASRDALIPMLQEVQAAYGYLPREAIVRIGRHLGLPASKVYGVATFYNQFRFQPKGRYNIVLCRGTSCHVKGSGRLLDTLKKHLKIEPGNTTRDGLFSLEVVACLGACALSPAICINDEFHAKVSPARALRLIDSLREAERAKARETAATPA